MKILLIEDDLRVSELVKRGLEEHGFDVSVAFDGITGKKLVVQFSFDLLIIDIILPNLNGLDLCREIRLLLPDIPIIILTALGTTDDKCEGFDAGADDYLVKPFEIRELVARIKSLLKRKINFSGNFRFILKYSDLEINLNTREVKRAGTQIKLTPMEFKLLEYMLRNCERVISKSEISEKVWGINFDTGTNFIDVYINYLRKKIDKNYNNKLIHTIHGVGFIMKEEQ